ncbi:DNA alkylation repair protein [Tsukamurella pulmonis]|uniref:3-methyladenine DNA glycosylase AlkD n=1 Tax=Tsukamurella pulmonis TaxID=47312 RepID=A0A1H1H077_9ACTN|nr:DNA alkylation repair protein [Tsukamurella pulmonis]KXO88132.1 DNA alkylation repair protein [Tsukamurella pulmonis]SDR18820.1 3-methyladenine DNA glycosylase AlkD [Tsukamurella pulmonis]SUP16237.1 DNA alkylation repair enzyme [Tsukamurella pulmonis]
MTRVDEVVAELAALEDPKARAVNERHGDPHGVNLTKLRAVAKSIGTDPDLARALWDCGDVPAQLVALLISRPKSYTEHVLDRMLRTTRSDKAHDWLLNYLVKKSPHAAALRERWLGDADPRVRAAGWTLTTHAVTTADLDRDALLDEIARDMRDAEPKLQWAMNETLATIGIEDEARRARAVAIGEELQVLADYPVSKGCTSPFAPIWIAEIVRRREA